jgi:hypothetical protein
MSLSLLARLPSHPLRAGQAQSVRARRDEGGEGTCAYGRSTARGRRDRRGAHGRPPPEDPWPPTRGPALARSGLREGRWPGRPALWLHPARCSLRLLLRVSSKWRSGKVVPPQSARPMPRFTLRAHRRTDLLKRTPANGDPAVGLLVRMEQVETMDSRIGGAAVFTLVGSSDARCSRWIRHTRPKPCCPTCAWNSFGTRTPSLRGSRTRPDSWGASCGGRCSRHAPRHRT